MPGSVRYQVVAGPTSVGGQSRNLWLEGSRPDLHGLGHFVGYLDFLVRGFFDDLCCLRWRDGTGGSCAGRCGRVGAHGKCTNDQSGNQLLM
jgi:hypothetical protein